MAPAFVVVQTVVVRRCTGYRPDSGKFGPFGAFRKASLRPRLPSQAILQKLIDLLTVGRLPIAISRTAPLSEAIALIGDLKAGRRGPGKAVVLLE